jgi:glucose/arabinose dehydrogenase
LTLGPDRTLFVALYGGTPFDGPPAAVVSLAPDAATRKGQLKPRLVALMQHPIALAATPDGLAVADYGGAPGERGKGELRLLSGVGTAAADGPGRQQPVGRSRLLASGLDRPTGLARLPDGRWAIAETGHTELTVLSSSRS